MASNFSFPPLAPEQIAEALHTYGLAPTANLRAEDIANPQPDLLPAVISNFLATVVDPTGADDLDGQLGFDALASLDNPEHYREGIRVLRLHKRANAFLESIQFPGFTLRDLLRPDPRRLVQVLSALINFLYYRDEKLALLQPIIHEFPNLDERCMELNAKIAEHQKAIADQELAAQMEVPMVQQLEAEVNSLKQKLLEYNKKQLALRANATAINDKKEETHRKVIAKSDFELVKLAQENSKLLSKIVQSPEKLQRALEEKKTARAELKNAEKIAMQSVQEKTATLEIYSKGYEKLSKHSSKIQALQEQFTATKALEKEVKARKAKISDESVEIMALDTKTIEWDGKVHEMEERVKAKEKERDQIVADENQKLAALRSEVEWKLKCLEPRERIVEETIAKATKLCAEVDSTRTDAAEELRLIYAKFQQIGHAFTCYKDNFKTFLEQVDEVSKETLESLGRQAVEPLDTSATLSIEKENSCGPAP
uniref:Kinetochore protein Nuf2 N-terminal domain-containing protein n=1 Tax=Oryza glumipatula TaxID=40148 RepID=A0A0D9Z9U4_9ORYZ